MLSDRERDRIMREIAKWERYLKSDPQGSLAAAMEHRIAWLKKQLEKHDG